MCGGNFKVGAQQRSAVQIAQHGVSSDGRSRKGQIRFFTLQKTVMQIETYISSTGNFQGRDFFRVVRRSEYSFRPFHGKACLLGSHADRQAVGHAEGQGRLRSHGGIPVRSLQGYGPGACKIRFSGESAIIRPGCFPTLGTNIQSQFGAGQAGSSPAGEKAV